ncbi:MAG: hypothetical protein M1840_008452 [Geoglossum simile]|nr:MAG: hypothetical protein M1840_008452 [Geoglossum simile]
MPKVKRPKKANVETTAAAASGVRAARSAKATGAATATVSNPAAAGRTRGLRSQVSLSPSVIKNSEKILSELRTKKTKKVLTPIEVQATDTLEEHQSQEEAPSSATAGESSVKANDGGKGASAADVIEQADTKSSGKEAHSCEEASTTSGGIQADTRPSSIETDTAYSGPDIGATDSDVQADSWTDYMETDAAYSGPEASTTDVRADTTDKNADSAHNVENISTNIDFHINDSDRGANISNSSGAARNIEEGNSNTAHFSVAGGVPSDQAPSITDHNDGEAQMSCKALHSPITHVVKLVSERSYVDRTVQTEQSPTLITSGEGNFTKVDCYVADCPANVALEGLRLSREELEMIFAHRGHKRVSLNPPSTPVEVHTPTVANISTTPALARLPMANISTALAQARLRRAKLSPRVHTLTVADITTALAQARQRRAAKISPTTTKAHTPTVANIFPALAGARLPMAVNTSSTITKAHTPTVVSSPTQIHTWTKKRNFTNFTPVVPTILDVGERSNNAVSTTPDPSYPSFGDPSDLKWIIGNADLFRETPLPRAPAAAEPSEGTATEPSGGTKPTATQMPSEYQLPSERDGTFKHDSEPDTSDIDMLTDELSDAAGGESEDIEFPRRTPGEFVYPSPAPAGTKHYVYGDWPPKSSKSEPVDPPPPTPTRKTWGFLGNGLVRLSSTVSSLLGRQVVDSSVPQSPPVDPQLENATEPVRRETRVRRVKFNNRRQSKTLSEIDEEQRNSVARARLRNAKKGKKRRPSPKLKSAMRKRDRSPMRSTSTNVITNTAPTNEAPLTRKRKYQCPAGTYGVPDSIFGSSDSDEPITPTRVSSETPTVDTTERANKRARVEPVSPTRKTPSPAASLRTKKKKCFSPPKGASFGLSDAFFTYTSSEESDEEQGVPASYSQKEAVPYTGPDPPSFLVPPPTKQVTWTEPPPPAPIPAHAKLPGDRTENTESLALARARSLTELYKPTRPSGLRRVSILSASTVSPTPSPLGTRLDDATKELEEAVQEEAVLPEAHQTEQTETRQAQQADAQPADHTDVHVPELEVQPPLQDDAHHTDAYHAHEAEIQPARQVNAQHDKGEDRHPQTPLAVDLVSKYPDVEFSPSDPSGLGSDRLVMSRLDENWTPHDENRAISEWAPIFNYVKRYHQAEREGRLFIP